MEREPQTDRERAVLLLRAVLVPGWLPTSGTQRLVWAIRIALVVGILVLIGSAYDKTLWNWLQLLIVPAVIAAGGVWFNTQQRDREQNRAHEHAQDEALQAYLDQMLQLLTDEKRPLHRAQPGDSLSMVARARTLTVLSRLGSDRKSSVLQFLYEAGLIDKENPIVKLSGISILGSITGAADLTGVNLAFAYLGEADLSGTVMTDAKLDFCGLYGVDLREADLSESTFTHTDLTSADLRHSVLSETVFAGTILEDANLEGVHLWGNDLTDADLSNANLREADFVGSAVAAMIGDPSESGLRDAILWNANLSGANLTGATITEEQLAQCRSLEGATMPNGQKYEDWLKSREEDGG